MSEIVQLSSKQELEEKVLKSKGIAIAYFTAIWCNPCKVLFPLIEEIVKEQQDLTVYKFDADESQEVVAYFGIRSIPTLIFFKDGVEVDRTTGSKSKTEILAKLSFLSEPESF